MRIALSSDAMVVLVGIAGSGKSTFARAHFAPTEILSSDAFRAVVADDEADQSASQDAFALLHAALDLRLRRARLAVVDATNVERWGRGQLLDIANRAQRPSVAIVLDIRVAICLQRIASRGVRPVPPHAVRRQQRELHRSLAGLMNEGFSAVYAIDTPEDVAAVEVERLAPIRAAHNEMSRRNRARRDDARSSNRHRNA